MGQIFWIYFKHYTLTIEHIPSSLLGKGVTNMGTGKTRMNPVRAGNSDKQ